MLDHLGTWPVTVGCAVFAVIAIAVTALWFVRGLWWTGALPASRGLLHDVRVATGLLELHADAVGELADEAATRASALPDCAARLTDAVEELRTEIRVLRRLIEEIPRARGVLRQELLETLVRP